MNKLQQKDDIFYTQNIETLPIEERLFLREICGVSATNENYRVATEQEIEEWKEYQKRQEEETL
jgi:hypothetical protein